MLYGLKYIYVSTSVVFQWAELLTEGAFPILKFRFRRPLNVKKVRFFFKLLILTLTYFCFDFKKSKQKEFFSNFCCLLRISEFYTAAISRLILLSRNLNLDWKEYSIRIDFTIIYSSTTWFWDWPSGFLDMLYTINLAFYSFSIIHLHFWSVFTDWTVMFGRFAKTKF